MKKILLVALVAVAIAAPYAIPGLVGVAAGSLAAIAITAAVEIGVAIASSALLGPTTPKIPNSLADGGKDRLFSTLVTTAPRKIAFGHTALGNDVRYQTYTGTNQEYIEQIVAHASHKVDAIDEFWVDNEKAWSATGGVVSKYASFLTVTTRTEGTSSNGIAIDSTWTSTATLTGCAYTHLKFLLIHKGSDGSNDSPFATGVTSRTTFRGKGALVYDPRLDSTVAGGLGTQSAADQSTWAWDDDASRNPALQLLFYLLGWKINGKLAVGMGLPPARIDLASFITAANACDEDVTLSDGVTTEPRYRCDGVLTEGDDRRAVIDALCASMNAVLRDSGGKLSITVLHDDLGSPVTPSGRTAFDQSDIIGDIQWDQTPDLNSIFNVVRGRRIDPSDNALYQPVDYPEVSLTSIDGIDRIETVDYPLVQSNGQAQRLAKQHLERNQYQGKIQFTGKPSFWGVSLGTVFPLTLAQFGWTEKLFRCAGQQISRTGETQLVAVEENAAIYAWDAEESPAVTPGTPTVYDPTNSPIQGGINDANKGTLVIDPVNDVRIAADSTSTIKTGELPRDVPITASNGGGDVTADGTWSVATATGITCTIGAATGVLNITALTLAEVYVTVSFTLSGVTRTANIHVVRIDDPPSIPGSTGGGTASSTVLGDTTGSAYDTTNAVSLTLTCAAGSLGEVKCSANISYKATDGSSSPDVHGKWQWRVVGGTFADIATEVVDSAQPGFDGPRNYVAGFVQVVQTQTGLTSGTSYEFRFLWRDDGSVRCYRTTGNMVATGQ